MLPTQRTLQWYRNRGWLVGVTERYNQYSRTRHDLFGFADLLAVNGTAIVAVQCTSQSNASKRVDKIRSECRENALKWLRAGGLIHVVGWRRLVTRNKDGTKAKVKRWEPRVEQITEEDLSGELEMATA